MMRCAHRGGNGAGAGASGGVQRAVSGTDSRSRIRQSVPARATTGPYGIHLTSRILPSPMFRMWMAGAVIVAVIVAPVTPRTARAGQCHVVDVDFTPADDGKQNAFPPQVVVWLEDTAGNYVDTLYI